MTGIAPRFIHHALRAALFTAPDTRAVRYLGSLRVLLGYDAEDPYAVRLAFEDPQLPVWRFARDLLLAGLHGPAGQGDVRIVPGSAKARVVLATDTGRCALFFHRAELVDFLAATATVVPPGGESAVIDWDRELARLGEVA